MVAVHLRLTFSAGGLVESARPGPPLLADLGPRLLCRPLNSCLISLLEEHMVKNDSAHIHTLKSSFDSLKV